MSTHKYSAFVKQQGKRDGKMEFSNSLLCLQKLILIDGVALVEIYDCMDKHNDKERLIFTLRKEKHIRYGSASKK